MKTKTRKPSKRLAAEIADARVLASYKFKPLVYRADGAFARSVDDAVDYVMFAAGVTMWTKAEVIEKTAAHPELCLELSKSLRNSQERLGFLIGLLCEADKRLWAGLGTQALRERGA